MICNKCNLEMYLSHIAKEVMNNVEKEVPIFVCKNKKCSQYDIAVLDNYEKSQSENKIK